MDTLRFYQAAPGAYPPQPADASVLGTLPTRAFRYCEPMRQASGLGWYLYPPAELCFQWDGQRELTWWFNGSPQGLLTEAVEYPGLPEVWDAAAPAALKNCAFPMMTPSQLHADLIQIWSGWLVRTPPEWGVLIRPVANFPARDGFDVLEGVIWTDDWFGPLFVNIRLTKTDRPVLVRYHLPLFQVQPIPRGALQMKHETVPFAAWSDEEWARYHATVVAPNQAEHFPLAAYATQERQRAAAERKSHEA